MFAGDDRVELVDRLHGLFRAVEADRGVRMVVLRAPTGFGKTRVAQELYERIAAEQPAPAYWPVRLAPEESSGWVTSRKRIYPPLVDVAPGAVMPWMWWGLSCSRRADGALTQALFEDATQLFAHGGSLFGLSGTSTAGRLFDGSGAVISLFGLLGLTVAPPVGAAIAVAGATRTAWQNKDLMSRWSTWRERRSVATESRLIDSESYGRSGAVVEIAENVALLSAKVPLVIVIDDAQWADATVVQFLDALVANRTARVLVVATMWPTSPDTRDLPFPAWAAESSAVEVVDLAELGLDALGQLVRAEYQAAGGDADALSDPLVAAVLQRTGRTPMAVRALFGLDRTRKLIGSGQFTLANLSQLPGDLTAVMRSYWLELPDQVRQVLVRAAVIGDRFPTVPLTIAALDQGVEDPESQLAKARGSFGFVRELEKTVDMFIDPIFHSIADAEAQESLIPDEIAALYQAVVDHAGEVEEGLEAELTWAVHVALARNGLVNRAQAVDSAWRLAMAAATRFDYVTAIELGTEALDWWAAIGDAVGPAEARASCQAMLASWLGNVGRVGEAASLFKQVLIDQERLLGNDHATSLTTRNNLAIWLGETGRVVEAVALLEQLLATQERILGPDHRSILITRNNLAYWLGHSGRVAEAVALFEQLLMDRTRVLGDDHPDTLLTRNNLASWLGQAGRVNEAVALFEQLLADRARVSGDDDPDTLVTRNNLASGLCELGRLEEAGVLFEQVLMDRVRVLGSDHPYSLSDRNNLASWLNEVGRADEALAMHEQVLSDRTRVLGPHHPDTLGSRNNLALTLCEVGRAAEAVALFEQLSLDYMRVLGRDHPDSLTSHHNLAHALSEVGRPDESVVLYEQVLLDRTRLMGADHPATLRAKSNWAFLLGEVGRVDDAVALLEGLLIDQERVLGADHPDTLATLSNRDYWRERTSNG